MNLASSLDTETGTTGVVGLPETAELSIALALESFASFTSLGWPLLQLRQMRLKPKKRRLNW
ncbi:MAG: hypothetical protein ABUM51_03880 [Bacteroidota bacterium]